MKLLGILLVVTATTNARADPFAWTSEAVSETRQLGTHRGASLSYETRSQPGGSSYMDVQITARWMAAGSLRAEQVLFFGKCAGGVSAARRGVRVVVTSACGKFDDLIHTTVWTLTSNRWRLVKTRETSRSPYREQAQRVRGYLARGDLALAATLLDRITTSSNGHDDLAPYWALKFLEAVRARGRRLVDSGDPRSAALGVAFVIHELRLRGSLVEAILDTDGRHLPCCGAGAKAGDARTRHNAWLINECAAMLLRGGGNVYDVIDLLLALDVAVPDRAATQLDLADAHWQLAGTYKTAGGGHANRQHARLFYKRYVELRREVGKPVTRRALTRSK